MRHIFIARVFPIPMVIAAFLLLCCISTAVSLCSSINRLLYKPYPFQPNCSMSLTMTTNASQNCMMAAAVSPTPSAVLVTSLVGSGGQCQVMPALCPRYILTNQSASLLMPSNLTALEHIVFSVKSGCGHKVWDLFTNPSAPNSDYVVQPAHPDAAILPDAFRSSLLDNMQRLISRLIYKQLIVQLYRNSSVVVRLVFDVGVSSESVTSLNWFDKTRLVESWPVTNLASMTTNFFSIQGNENIKRRFFINYNYGGCSVDKGFLAVLDAASDVCSSFENSGMIPGIFYNPFPSLAWANSTVGADYLAVLIR